MICVIRIKGKVGIPKKVENTLDRLRLRKKYSCIVLEKPTPEQIGMIRRFKDFVAFGELKEDTYKKLQEKRKTKIKGFFRLHPPRGGIKTKLSYPRGVLGNHKDKINELVERML